MKIRVTPLSGRPAFIWAGGWFSLATLLTFALWKPFMHVVPFLAFFSAVALTAARNGPLWGLGSAISAIALLFAAGKIPSGELVIRGGALLANSAFIIWLGALLRRTVLESQVYRESIADAVSDFVWSCDSRRRPLYVNSRMLEFFGFNEKDFDRAAWRASVHPDSLAAWERTFETANRTGEHYDFEVRYRRHDGTYRWFMSRAVPIKKGHGDVDHWVGTSTDIDARKSIEMEREQLLASERQARSDAERSSRMKDDFLATVSHELRTPLNAIVGWVYLLKGEKVGEGDVRDGLAVIERNTRAQVQLIDDLLDMSRIISGNIRLNVQTVDLSVVIDSAIEAIQPSADAKQIRLTKAVNPFPGEVRGDPARLQQIIWNLLGNAIKFTPKGGHVIVTLARLESHVEISISDSGDGIAPAFLPHIFERFRQADGSSTRRHGGLGLGLAIVKQLVELHGGTVHATSAGEGHGATFSVHLPLLAARVIKTSDTREDHGVREGKRSQAESSKLAHVNVLVVDDEPDSRAIIKRILGGFGARVTTAASVKEAMLELSTGRYHTLISDIGMPDMDGFEFMRKVRAGGHPFGNDIPAIALTAFARSEDRLRSMQVGYDVFLSKPVDPAELLAVVERCASRSSSQVPQTV